MRSTPAAVDRVATACDDAVRATAGTALAADAAAVRDRFHGPLRVAIAGRVKAGKSTLLNALVGERLAATDAGECTRIVTTYHWAEGYEVEASTAAGERRPLRFRRSDGSLQIDVGSVEPTELESIDVGWPARSLQRLTLVDTPGLASLDESTSRRTVDFLDADHGTGPGADAVIYLMRHLHHSDTEFLGAFMDRRVVGASPISSVAVLSRADEIGACRLDALDSASRIAARYATEPAIRTLVSGVLPIAGLLAETGLTLREDEVADLRLLASMPADERAVFVRSVDDVRDVNLSPLTAERRTTLLDRFGLYGLRFCIDRLTAEPGLSATGLSRAMVERSGLGELQRVLTTQFASTGRLLQARSAVRGLRQLARALEAHAPAEAANLARTVEEIETSSGDFTRLAAAHLAASGAAALSDDARAEATRLLLAADPESEVAHMAQHALLDSIERWRARAGGAFADTALVTVCEAMARVYEVAYAATLR
jgi:hypothetical protein